MLLFSQHQPPLILYQMLREKMESPHFQDKAPRLQTRSLRKKEREIELNTTLRRRGDSRFSARVRGLLRPSPCRRFVSVMSWNVYVHHEFTTRGSMCVCVRAASGISRASRRVNNARESGSRRADGLFSKSARASAVFHSPTLSSVYSLSLFLFFIFEHITVREFIVRY